jgi:ectoine hydroxylase-related dioxygenase (phytanoyl-CoA dioxygenase family)
LCNVGHAYDYFPQFYYAILESEARTVAKAGDAVIFVGTLQHCAMPNHSTASRTVLLIQYLAKWVRPMEDQKRMLTEEVLKK